MSKLFKLIGAFTASVFLLLSITTSVSAEKKILFSIILVSLSQLNLGVVNIPDNPNFTLFTKST